MLTRDYRVLVAPSTLGLASAGVEQLPDRFLELGFASRIRAREIDSLPMPSKTGERDAHTGVLNAHEMATWSPMLADAVASCLSRKRFPIVLGGDCTILLGSMLALRRRGRYGLLFIDGNADFFQPEAEPNGEGASMDLAFVTGFGPSLLTNLEGRAPLVRPQDVIAFAFRDHEDQALAGSQPLPSDLRALDLHAVRRMGVERAALDAVAHVSRAELDGFFIHIDADCLDDTIMPAVDFRVPGGLTWGELSTTLRIALESDKAVGLEVAIYNPSLDHDGSAGRQLVDTLVTALTSERAPSTMKS